jgi:hypothetical protein
MDASRLTARNSQFFNKVGLDANARKVNRMGRKMNPEFLSFSRSEETWRQGRAAHGAARNDDLMQIAGILLPRRRGSRRRGRQGAQSETSAAPALNQCRRLRETLKKWWST